MTSSRADDRDMITPSDNATPNPATAKKKLVYLIWPPSGQPREETRRILLEESAPHLLEKGAICLQMNIADQYAEVKSPTPSLPFEQPVVAQVNIWVHEEENRVALEDVLRGAGFQIAGYLVDEQIYTDYGGNEYAGPRTWPDGERSPGVLAVTLMERPKRLSHEEWIRRWHGRQSEMSEAIQPRCRYVRNVVLRPLTAGAPPFEGIVEEGWPSFEHVTNKRLFYGASSTFGLVANMLIMLRSVVAFLDLWRIRTIMTSEYFLKTERPPG